MLSIQSDQSKADACNGKVLDDSELQLRLIYSVVVAGKSARFAEAVMQRFLELSKPGETPLDTLRRLREIHGVGCSAWSTEPFVSIAKLLRTGNYAKIAMFFADLCDRQLSLATCTLSDLEALRGIGPKTARFFVLWTRPDPPPCAALDTHVLKWMATQGYAVPRQTPSSRGRYLAIEQSFLSEADSRGVTPRELDFAIWDHYAQGRPLPDWAT